jgi:hypothetical protein
LYELRRRLHQFSEFRMACDKGAWGDPPQPRHFQSTAGSDFDAPAAVLPFGRSNGRQSIETGCRWLRCQSFRDQIGAPRIYAAAAGGTPRRGKSRRDGADASSSLMSAVICLYPRTRRNCFSAINSPDPTQRLAVFPRAQSEHQLLPYGFGQRITAVEHFIAY